MIENQDGEYIMNVLVLYQSRKGHTQAVAQAIAEMAEQQDHTVTLKSVIETSQEDVASADMLFIGTWVQGFILFGVKPAEATLWVPALPSLGNKPTAIFCTYAFHPHKSLQKLASLLEEKGASIIGQQAFHRNQPPEEAKPFVQSMLETAKNRTTQAD